MITQARTSSSSAWGFLSVSFLSTACLIMLLEWLVLESANLVTTNGFREYPFDVRRGTQSSPTS
jgi:hypothetical protein